MTPSKVFVKIPNCYIAIWLLFFINILPCRYKNWTFPKWVPVSTTELEERISYFSRKKAALWEHMTETRGKYQWHCCALSVWLLSIWLNFNVCLLDQSSDLSGAVVYLERWEFCRNCLSLAPLFEPSSGWGFRIRYLDLCIYRILNAAGGEMAHNIAHCLYYRDLDLGFWFSSSQPRHFAWPEVYELQRCLSSFLQWF